MKRIDAREILDSDDCSPEDVAISMRDLGRVNRWFGGVRTTQKLIERVAQIRKLTRLSVLEVAAGAGELPQLAAQRLARRGITLDLTLLDRAASHLPRGERSVVGDALRLPFSDSSCDVVSCNLFVHHLPPDVVKQFSKEALRVSRHALVINDLVRDPVHFALAYAAYPILRSRVAWRDGVTSVRRAYLPREMREMILAASFDDRGSRVEISRHYLYRMGAIVWKGGKLGVSTA